MPKKPIKTKIKDLPAARPFLKWLGGKTRVMPFLEQFLKEGTRLIEPFAGSGTVALNASLHCSNFKSFLLADINHDLINVYRQLHGHGERFIQDCEALYAPVCNTPDFYYTAREEFNTTKDDYRKACLFVYMNRHGYNGVCRYNASGGYNVPYGRYKHTYFPGAEMREFAKMLERCELVVADFADIIKLAGAGDVLYCDPPYVALSATAAFTSYSKGGFGAKEQQKLVEEARLAAERGAVVVISNHDTPESRELYADASQLHSIMVQRNVSGTKGTRVKAPELVAIYKKA